MRVIVGAAALLGLVACSAELPDSAAGVGFDTSLPPPDSPVMASPLPPPDAVSEETLTAYPVTLAPAPASPGSVASARSAAAAPVSANADLAAETAAALAAAEANSGVAPVAASPQNPPPPMPGNPGLSDENDFAAVSGRESIQSDAARLAQNREQYAAVAPTAVPERPRDTAPNVVTYALGTTHARGTRLYSRSGINLAARAQRACARYPSPDKAQAEFLAQGGPQRDRLGVDPDGDGYACAWDPAPFRKAVGN